MKKPFLFLLLTCFSLAASAQKVYFAYFQSDDQSPFYVKLADKVYNSATAGYLTISNLQDTAYTFHIGFTSNPGAEKEFKVKVNGADLGLNVKNLPDGPQLFDMQNAILIAPVKQDEPADVAYEERNDPFSKMLSKAADDPTLLKKPVNIDPPQPKEEKVAKTTKEPASRTEKEVVLSADEKTSAETAAVNTTTTDSTSVAVVEGVTEKKEEAAPPVTNQEQKEQTPPAVFTQAESDKAEVLPPDAEFERSRIRRYSETSTTEGFGLVYFDNVKGERDTIRLLIPNPKVALVGQSESKTDDGFFLNMKKEEEPPAAPKEEKKAEEKTAETQQLAEEKPAINLPKAIINTSCTSEATEKDFFKLRRNMAGRITDEDMIEEARKVFKKMCFSTQQVRYLSSLFLTSAGKYQFFDAAFEYTSDKENFKTLQSEIKDPYYVNRFKALVGE